jgi:hypothetical protein
MPADGTLAALTPAEISASLPRHRQLGQSTTLICDKQVRSTDLIAVSYQEDFLLFDASVLSSPPLPLHGNSTNPFCVYSLSKYRLPRCLVLGADLEVMEISLAMDTPDGIVLNAALHESGNGTKRQIDCNAAIQSLSE